MYCGCRTRFVITRPIFWTAVPCISLALDQRAFVVQFDLFKAGAPGLWPVVGRTGLQKFEGQQTGNQRRSGARDRGGEAGDLFWGLPFRQGLEPVAEEPRLRLPQP